MRELEERLLKPRSHLLKLKMEVGHVDVDYETIGEHSYLPSDRESRVARREERRNVMHKQLTMHNQ